MSAIGSLRVDAKVGGQNVSTKIGVEEKGVVEFIDNNVPYLRDRLQKIGYQSEVTCCIQEKNDMQIESGLEELLIRDPNRLIDIET